MLSTVVEPEPGEAANGLPWHRRIRQVANNVLLLLLIHHAGAYPRKAHKPAGSSPHVSQRNAWREEGGRCRCHCLRSQSTGPCRTI